MYYNEIFTKSHVLLRLQSIVWQLLNSDLRCAQHSSAVRRMWPVRIGWISEWQVVLMINSPNVSPKNDMGCEVGFVYDVSVHVRVMYTCAHVHAYGCMCVYMCASVFVYMCTCVYGGCCMYVLVCIYIYIYSMCMYNVCESVHIFICMCNCVHINVLYTGYFIILFLHSELPCDVHYNASHACMTLNLKQKSQNLVCPYTVQSILKPHHV